MGGRGGSSGFGWSPSANQSAFEADIRNSTSERGAYFDSQGNLLLQGEGNRDEITYDSAEVNRNVEQRIWQGEQVDYVHNHPDNTIFSPEDLETFEYMENRSMRAVLPNGKSYTLIRNQPRTSNVVIIDTKTGMSRREFEPKKIYSPYNKAYTAALAEGNKLVHEAVRSRGNIPYREQENIRWGHVTTKMEQWLRKNARRYGYIFKG